MCPESPEYVTQFSKYINNIKIGFKLIEGGYEKKYYKIKLRKNWQL